MDTHNLKYITSFLLLILLLLVGCTEDGPIEVDNTVHGCTDSQACNYNPDANIDNNSCIHEIDCNGECGGEAFEDECGVCEGNSISFITENWDIQIIARMQPWKIFDWISDEENYLGVSENASDGYDLMDIPDPPVFDTNWIKAYFYHPEWDSTFGDNFTQEYQSNAFCGSKVWNLIIDANSLGPLRLEFIFNNVPDSFESGLNLNLGLYEDGNYLGLLTNGSIIESDLESNTPKEFLISIYGN
jgi:hypothetical protein